MTNRCISLKALTTIVFFSIFISTACVCFAEEVTGRRVAEWVYNRDDGNDNTFNIKMTLTDKRGRKRERELIIQSRDEGKLVNTFLEFTSPADIDGTRFLTLENKGKDDTQYLYLPALGRTRRIVGSQKKQNFMNTDYTYEDMERQHPDENKHKFLREENFSGWNCYVTESVPVEDRDSQYSRMIVWVDKKSHVIVKTDYYNKKKRLTKRFTVTDLKKMDGIWTQADTLMEDLRRKTSTRMTVTEAKYNQGLDEQIFTKRRLEQI